MMTSHPALHCAGDRKTFHAAVLVHPTAYDGSVELASLSAGIPVLSSSANATSHNCAKEIVKNHLVDAPCLVCL